LDADKVLTFGLPTFLEGVWDLTMIGAESVEVERRYQKLTHGPAFEMPSRCGPIVNRPDGSWAWIVYDDTEFDRYPSESLRSDALFVVRTSALENLEAQLSESEPDPERPIGQRERDTLLVIIAALARLAKINVAKPSAAAAAIEGEAALMGIRIGLTTIEGKLRLIHDALERRGAEGEPKGPED
jgi:hypothetical protein